ncbi:bacillolysin [Streptomyces sp. TLI_053]|uniref:M4 family metallopeptidase n=1 Tax=Streptomyces sp. TLI_053 TaxID=1855352 RepID=UPI00087A0C37|nr:M4 family metallopeptidase [Streptomyces sp. TLI_053]SDT82826.1 bacillolysin [Streptomyces sp. TLI_053]
MHHRSRTPGPKLLGVAIAVVLGLAVAVPPAFAGPAGGPSADADPVPGLVAGSDTGAPQLVTGLAEAAPGDNPAEAARAHLAAHQDRYRIDPGQLVEAGVERAADGRRTVRFEQRHGGIPVFGARYLVHLVGEGNGQRVESAGGKYFTGLTAPTVQSVPDEVLRRLAIGAVQDPVARAGATAEDRGPVVLPGGAGRLARHFTVRGSDPAVWAAKAQEVFVDASTGEVALSYQVRAPYPLDVPGAAASGVASGVAASAAATSPDAAAAAPALEPATGTAPDALGRPARVNIGRLPDGTYQLVDLTRPATVTTYDAAGRDELDFSTLPADAHPAASPTTDFPAVTGTSGATDAHLNAAAVYDFYRDRLGRDGIDGKGGPITSVVNVTSFGEPLDNAYWDGRKMVYGGGSGKYLPFSAARDVAGHEMTHGVVKHTAELVGLGQSGALDEAVADYFGNAIEVTGRGMPMTDPRAALLGEDLCRTGTPEACAGRRLDDRRTTVADYVGAPAGVDNGGVHLNSTIFSGALWDIRRTLDPLLADRLVYRALAEYLTPLDDFVDARNAVLAAGRTLGLSRAQLRTVASAFDAHGIKDGWQRRIGVDSRPLLRELSTESVAPDVAAGRWVAATAGEGAKGSMAVYTGAVAGSAEPARLSAEDGRSHGWPATDGTTAAWVAMGPGADGGWGMEVLARPLDGGPARSVQRGANQYFGDVRVSGGDVAFLMTDYATGRGGPVLSRAGAPAVPIALPEGHRASALAFRDGLLAWTESWQVGERTVSAPTVYSLAAGKVVAQYVVDDANAAAGTEVGSTRLAGGRLLWVETPFDRTKGSTIRSGALDGSGVSDLLPAGPRLGTGTEPRRISGLTASDRAVTFAEAARPVTGGTRNTDLPKLWQLPLTGGTPERMSCNRGGQYSPVADRGTRVVWLDATAGRTDLVVRERAAGTC